MSEESVPELISESCHYIFMKGKFLKAVQLKSQRQIQLGKVCVDTAGILGQPVGSSFKLLPKDGKERVFHAQVTSANEDLADEIVADHSVDDNRHLVASGESQHLSTADIDAMKERGVCGREIVSTIVENSDSFDAKTEYAQAKYVRKKQSKHFELITVCRPNVRLLAQMYYIQSPLKILNLRMDMLSQLLTACALYAGCHCVVFESGGGVALCTAAVLQCLGATGRLVHVHSGTGGAQRQAVELMNFSDEQLRSLVSVDIEGVLERFGRRRSAGIVTAGPTSDCADGRAESATDVSVVAATKETSHCWLPVKRALAPNGVDSGDDGSMMSNAAKRRKTHTTSTAETALQWLRARRMDALIICSRQHPCSVAILLVDFLAPSRPFAVFCAYKEPLLEAYFALKSRGCIMLKLSETWLREYQVLPDRTHPEVNMSGGGGYILSGYKVHRCITDSVTPLTSGNCVTFGDAVDAD